MVEILVVITIISILAGLILGGITVATNNKDKVDTKNTLMTLTIALEKYKKERGVYPTKASWNSTLMTTLLKYETFYVDGNGNAVDSWGQAISYVPYGEYTSTNASFFSSSSTSFINPNSFQLRSAGPDGTWGNADDVENFEVSY